MVTKLKKLWEAVWWFLFYIQPNDSPQEREWRAEDLARVTGTAALDGACVGKLVGTGMQHRIYEYQDPSLPMVLKLTIILPFLRFPSMREAQQDVALIGRYLAPYAVEPTRVIPLRDGTYAILQRRLVHRHAITRADLNDTRLREQFLDILERNRRMIREAGRSLDFLGREGQRKARAALIGMNQTPTISNLVVEEEPGMPTTLRLIDTDLENLYVGAHSLRDRQSAWAAKLAVGFNRWLIRHFFGIDIMKDGEAALRNA